MQPKSLPNARQILRDAQGNRCVQETVFWSEHYFSLIDTYGDYQRRLTLMPDSNSGDPCQQVFQLFPPVFALTSSSFFHFPLPPRHILLVPYAIFRGHPSPSTSALSFLIRHNFPKVAQEAPLTPALMNSIHASIIGIFGSPHRNRFRRLAILFPRPKGIIMQHTARTACPVFAENPGTGNPRSC